MVFWVSSSSLRDILRLERSPSKKKKKKTPKFDLAIAFFLFIILDAVCLLSAVVFFLRPFLWSILAFHICGNCLQTLQNALQQMGNRITILGSMKHPIPRMAKTYSCCTLTPMPWAHLHPMISQSLKKKEDMLFFHSI